MKRSASKIIGILIGIVAIYFSVRNVNPSELKESFSHANWWFLFGVVVLNFVVAALKALRWHILMKPLKDIKFSKVFRALIIGFMANNVLPARLGEVVRVQLIKSDSEMNFVTTTGSLVADKIVESVSFLFLAALLILLSDVPQWMHYGLTMTLLITVAVIAAAFLYSQREMKNVHFRNFQEGISPLRSFSVVLPAFGTSIASWFIQLCMIYVTQVAFGVSLPIWSSLLVLIAVNLAVIVPSAPANLGTFELACVLAYTSLGLDKSLGLLIGASYHLLQAIPVTIVGGVLIGLRQFFSAQDTPYLADQRQE